MSARRNTALTIALRSYQARRYEPARRACLDVLEDDPNDPVALHLLGLIAYSENNLDEAIGYMVAAAAVDPDSLEIRTNLGLAFRTAGRLDAAEEQFHLALSLKPDDPALLNELAQTLMDRMRVEEAVEILERAMVLAPNLAEIRNSLGNAYHRLGNTAKAVSLLKKALALNPDYMEAHINMGVALREDGQPEEGLPFLSRAAELAPRNAEVAVQLGVTLRAVEQFDDAFLCFERAVSCDPDHADARNNFGAMLVERGHVAQGEAHLRCAVALRPGFTNALANLGAALLELGRVKEARDVCEEALTFDPDSVGAHWNRALVLLTEGRLEDGYEEYEWRWKLPRFQPLIRDRGCPLWDGKIHEGMALQLHSEQGFGDVIQFGRYAPYLAAQGMKIILEVPNPLVELMTGMDGDITVVPMGKTGEGVKAHTPLMSLPRLCGTEDGDVPDIVPYIKPDPVLVDRVEAGGRLSVGLCWQGSQTNGKDYCRSIPLKAFASLAAVPGVQLFCLQKGDGRSQMDQAGVEFAGDIGPDFGDFPETAALMSKLDVVVSVDTAMAHLAGALGRPTCLLLTAFPDWRWTLKGAKSIWYPTMSLYRQKETGAWAPVIERLVKDLAKQAG